MPVHSTSNIFKNLQPKKDKKKRRVSQKGTHLFQSRPLACPVRVWSAQSTSFLDMQRLYVTFCNAAQLAFVTGTQFLQAWEVLRGPESPLQ